MQIHTEARPVRNINTSHFWVCCENGSSISILFLTSVALVWPAQNGESGTKSAALLGHLTPGVMKADQLWSGSENWHGSRMSFSPVLPPGSWMSVGCSIRFLVLFRFVFICHCSYFFFILLFIYLNFFFQKCQHLFGILTRGWYWTLCFSSTSWIGHLVPCRPRPRPEVTASRIRFSVCKQQSQGTWHLVWRWSVEDVTMLFRGNSSSRRSVSRNGVRQKDRSYLPLCVVLSTAAQGGHLFISCGPRQWKSTYSSSGRSQLSVTIHAAWRKLPLPQADTIAAPPLSPS